MNQSELDFDSELSRGLAAYNDRLGEWWCSKARDSSHTRAYRNIAAFIRASLPRPPRRIVDYACGAGHLLARLGTFFHGSTLIGLDGSPYLLNLARRRLGRLRRGARKQARLIEIQLPAVDLPRVNADLAVYAFPNMVWPARKADRPHMESAEIKIARSLTQQREAGGWEENFEEIFPFLTMGRLVSRDLHRLVKRGGLCIRAEYAGARRDELTQLECARISFEEGSLDMPVDGWIPRQLFRVVASAYFRSQVIADVHQQAGTRGGRGGGYQLTVLRAL